MLLKLLKSWHWARLVSGWETPEVGEEVPPAAAGPQAWSAI